MLNEDQTKLKDAEEKIRQLTSDLAQANKDKEEAVKEKNEMVKQVAELEGKIAGQKTSLDMVDALRKDNEFCSRHLESEIARLTRNTELRHAKLRELGITVSTMSPTTSGRSSSLSSSSTDSASSVQGQTPPAVFPRDSAPAESTS